MVEGRPPEMVGDAPLMRKGLSGRRPRAGSLVIRDQHILVPYLFIKFLTHDVTCGGVVPLNSFNLQNKQAALALVHTVVYLEI